MTFASLVTHSHEGLSLASPLQYLFIREVGVLVFSEPAVYVVARLDDTDPSKVAFVNLSGRLDRVHVAFVERDAHRS